MRTSSLVLVALPLLLASCEACSRSIDPYVVPSSKPVPPQPPNACDLESDAVRKLGGCGVWSPRYADDCRALEEHEVEDHHRKVDHTCVINAKDCDTAKACP